MKTSLQGSGQVCVESLDVCEQLGVGGTCIEDLAIISCQFLRDCGYFSGEFDSCIAQECQAWAEDPPADCPLAAGRVLSGSISCP